MSKDSKDRKGPKYYDHNGFLMPHGFPVENYESGLTYEPKPSDLIVTTYPKCGTTWMQNIIYLILNKGKRLPNEVRLHEIFPHLEEVGKEKVEALPSDPYRLIKVHLPFETTPYSSKAKYIYVTRNPKDCVVSFFHHTRGFIYAYDYENGTFDEYFDLFLEGKVDFGDYFDNLTGWLKQSKVKENIFFITYESLKQNPRDGILRIAEFIDPKYKAELLLNDEAILKDVLTHSSFEGMSKDQNRWSSERPEGHTRFVRRGETGKWKSTLSEDQSKRMDKKIRSRLSEEDINYIWPDAKEYLFLNY